MSRRKFNNKIVKNLDGSKAYDSKRERDRHGDLMWLEKAGVINDLQFQVKFALKGASGKVVCTWTADFTYFEDGKYIVEDCKGHKTDMYILKKKWMEADYGVIIRET